jgi:hypothetical protein
MPALTFDEFGTTPSGVPVGKNGLPRVVVTGAESETPSKALTFDEFSSPETNTDTAIRYGKDIGKSLVSGLDKGVAGLAGLPADAALGVNYLANVARSKISGRPFDEVEAEQDQLASVLTRENLKKWGGKAIHEASGLAHKPETTSGRYVESGAEFVPAAIMGGGPLVRNALALGVAPGLASEAAGQATEGTAYEPYARAGAAVLGGATGHWATAPNAAGAAVSRASRGANQAQVDAAEQLFQYAQSIGLPITRAEAVQHVTGGATNLGNLQRVVEGSGELRPFMAARPGQVDDAARTAFGGVGPVSADPHGIGPTVGAAAQGTVQDVTQAINRATRPLYQAAERQGVGVPVHQALMGDPLYAQTLQEVRNNPALNRTIAHLPDDNVGVIDLVQRRLREQADNAVIPGQASTSNLAAANYGDARTAPMAAADTATGSRPGVQGAYEAARAEQARLREQYLTPLMNGPVGKLAQNDIPTQKAISVLFPANPLPNSEQAIGQAVQAVAHRNPRAAAELVRAHVEQTFNDAVSRLQSGANEFGGAGFAAALRGNPQQAANLEAAITALRGGQAYQGFDRFLTILEAQGSRQRIGSQTAFNQEVQAGLKQGGTVAEALTAVATGGLKIPSKVAQRVEQWRMGGNVAEIADILTNPAAAQLFRQLATAPTNSAKAGAIITRLTYLAERGRENAGGGGGTVDPTTILATGDMKLVYNTGVLTGFVRANGRTIGSATSGASERANADTSALFTFLWNADANLAVSGGRGASAAADYAANKTITLPDYRGRAVAGLDDMGNSAAGRLTATYFGTAATVLGAASTFTDSRTIGSANLPTFSVTVTATMTYNTSAANYTGGGTQVIMLQPDSVPTNLSPFSKAAVASGSFTGTNTPISVIPPTMLATIYLKL